MPCSARNPLRSGISAKAAAEAQEIIDAQVSTIEAEWSDAANAARLTAVERAQLWRRQVLNPAIHYDL